MKYVTCSSCKNQQTPINNSISIDGVIVCVECFKTHFKDVKVLKGKKVEAGIDPTVCSSCDKDFGELQLKKLGSYPVCDDCNKKISERTFPTWVKAFMVGLVILVVFSFMWNLRFFNAYNELKKSSQAFMQQDYRQASLLMKQASEDVSELNDLALLAAYYEGMALLSEDKNEEALSQFAICSHDLPNDYNVKSLMLQAEMGAGFNSKDYARFLYAAQSFLERDSSYFGWASVASAYACLYAESGKDSLKVLSKFNLERALIGVDDPSLAEFVQRIEHRLATRDIITKTEFDKRFPNGWTHQ